MDLDTLGEPGRIPRRMHGCFHNPPYIQVETMDNLLHKHGCSLLQILTPILLRYEADGVSE